MAAGTSTYTSPDTPLPPILALPCELKQEIISQLSGDDKYYSVPALMALRRTHPMFRKIIPRKHHLKSKFKSSVFKTAQLLFYTELKHPYLIPPDLYPCYDCHRVLHTSRFGVERIFRGGVRPIGKPSLSGRTCDECWDVWEASHGQLHY